MDARRTALLALATALVVGCAAGCRSAPLAPYAWKSAEGDPRLSIRVPADTAGAVNVPYHELVPPSRRARSRGEVEWPDPRLACREEASEEFERNELVLFLGYTGVRAGDGGTVGLGYERRLTRRFALSVFGEHVFGASNVSVFGGGIALKPTERNKFLLLAGVEVEQDGETNPLVRMGITHSIGSWQGLEVSPAVYLDVVRNNPAVVVLGFEFGKGW